MCSRQSLTLLPILLARFMKPTSKWTHVDFVDRWENHSHDCNRLVRTLHPCKGNTCPRCYFMFYNLIARFMTAQTIIHEFAHAVSKAVYGCRGFMNLEIPPKPGRPREAGFDICAHLFGGGIVVCPKLTSKLPLKTIEGLCNRGIHVQDAQCAS